MRILVPVKQVPESGNVKMDPATGTVIRAGVETVVNPLDLYAIEAALRLREQYGGEVIALSMGPPSAMRVLREAAAMGVDSCVLLSDRRFGGADTWATSYTLAQCAKKLMPLDLIVTGERATDGDTAQVGPALAAWLDMPALTYCATLPRIAEDRVHLERLTEDGYEIADAPLPCLISVVKEIAVPRLPTLKGKIRSRDLAIPTYSADDIDADPACIGLAGSPTRVVTIETPVLARGGKTITVTDDESLGRAVDELLSLLTEKGVL